MPDPAPTLTLDSPEVKNAIEQAVASAIEPLKRKNEELLEEKHKLTEKYKNLDDEEITKFNEFRKRLETDEEAKLIAEGKIDDVLNRRTERMRESLSKRVTDAETLSKEWEEKYNASQAALHNNLIDAEVRNAALASNVVPTALDDVLTRARSIFSFDDGKIISRDPATNEIRMSDDAKNPYSPKDFMADLKKTAPHFWPQSQTGGFSGGSGGTPSDYDVQAQAALQKGGMQEYLKVRERQRKSTNGK